MGLRLDVLHRCHLAIVLRLSYKLDYDDDENPVYAVWRLPRRCRPAGPDNGRHGLHRSAAGDTSCGYDVGNHDIGRYAGGDADSEPLVGRRADPGTPPHRSTPSQKPSDSWWTSRSPATSTRWSSAVSFASA